MLNTWQTHICNAVHNGDAAALEQLCIIANNQSLDFREISISPLTEAVKKRDYVITEKLLDAGASVDFPNVLGFTALMFAAMHGDMDICRLLLKHGADVHATTRNDTYTPLHHAVYGGELKTAAVLLEHGAKIYDPTKPWQKQTSTLEVAAALGQSDMLSFLLEYCNKIDMKVPLSSLFYYAATYAGSEQCAIIALKQGYYPHHLIAWPHGTWFQMVADTGSLRLMSVLVELNPHFLQEDWLIQHQFPDKVTEQPNFVDWLVGLRKQPPCLQKLCRSVILSQLVTYCIPKVGELPLPRLLKTYLTAVDSAYDWS